MDGFINLVCALLKACNIAFMLLVPVHAVLEIAGRRPAGDALAVAVVWLVLLKMQRWAFDILGIEG